MDFALTDDQQSLQALARQILAEQSTHDRLKVLEATAKQAGGWSVVDRELWKRLADAGLTGIGIPEQAGGAGLGFLDVALVLEEVGRHVAPVPAVPTLVTAYVLGRHGLATDILPRVAAGDAVVTSAFDGDVTARRDGEGWRLTGEAPFVPYGAEADLVVVAVTTDDGERLALLPAGTAGVTVTEQQTTNREPTASLAFAELELPAAAVVADADVAHELRLHLTAGLAMVAAGVCQQALAITAKHTSSREQFGKAIASFQAVGQRAADAYIDTETVRLTALQAVWRLDAGFPADDEVAVAKFWVGDGGMRALHACQHLHGGLGVDLDYPLHRYFVWGKQLEHELGAPTRQLLTLGASLAATPV